MNNKEVENTNHKTKLRRKDGDKRCSGVGGKEFSKSEMESSLEILMERIEKIEQEQGEEAEQKQEQKANDRKINKKKQVRKSI